jgi:hypothetical protein
MIVACIILAVLAVVCAGGWLRQYVGSLVFLHYLDRKGYPLPSAEDVKTDSQWAAKKVLRGLGVNPDRR